MVQEGFIFSRTIPTPKSDSLSLSSSLQNFPTSAYIWILLTLVVSGFSIYTFLNASLLGLPKNRELLFSNFYVFSLANTLKFEYWQQYT